MRETILAASLLLAAGLAFGPPAEAGYVVTLTQVGPNVVATGSGAIDLTYLTLNSTRSPLVAGVSPALPEVITGPATSQNSDVYIAQEVMTGPLSFGNGFGANASSGSGDLVGILAVMDELFLPNGYSGGRLSDTSTYDNQTFASLGATPGTYVWRWEGGPNDNFTLIVGTTATPVPEPGSLALLATALLGIGAVGWCRRRA